MQWDWKSAVFQSTRPRSKYLILSEISNHAVTISTYLQWHFRIRSKLFALHIFAFARSLALSFKTYSHTERNTRSFCPNKINFSLEFAFSQFLCVMRKIPKPNHFFIVVIVAVLHACVWEWSTDSIVCIMVSILNFISNFLGARLQPAREIQTYCIFCSGNKVIGRKMCYTYSPICAHHSCSLCVWVLATKKKHVRKNEEPIWEWNYVVCNGMSVISLWCVFFIRCTEVIWWPYLI